MSIICLLIKTTILVAVLTHVNCDLLFKLQKCYCTLHNPKKIQNLKCWLKPVNRTTTLLNLRFSLIQPIDELFFNAKLYKKAEIIYRPFLINVTFNYCDYMKKKFSSAYTRIVGPIYLPYSNLNHTCPYSGDIYVKDLQMDVNKFPSFWPSGNYKLDILAFEKNSSGLTLQVYFEVNKVHRASYLLEK